MAKVILFSRDNKLEDWQLRAIEWVDNLDWKIWKIGPRGKSILKKFVSHPEPKELVLREKTLHEMGLNKFDASRLETTGFLNGWWGQDIFINGKQVPNSHPYLANLVEAAENVQFIEYSYWHFLGLDVNPPTPELKFNFKHFLNILDLEKEILEAHHTVLPQLAKVVHHWAIERWWKDKDISLSEVVGLLGWPRSLEAYRRADRALWQSAIFFNPDSNPPSKDIGKLFCRAFGNPTPKQEPCESCDNLSSCLDCQEYYMDLDKHRFVITTETERQKYGKSKPTTLVSGCRPGDIPECGQGRPMDGRLLPDSPVEIHEPGKEDS